MKRHIAGMDALRALAILGVTFFHMFPGSVVGGYLGVSLFFVLTGYLLAYTSVGAASKQGFFWVFSYYGKRIRRIYPELLLMLLVTIGACHFLAPDAIEAVRPEVLSVLGGYNNWWQIAQNMDYFTRITNVSPFTHLWFLGIELQYYLVWPLVFGLYLAFRVLCGARFAAGIILFFGVVSAAFMPLGYVQGVDITRLYYGTDTRVYALLLGAGVGLWQAEERRRRRRSAGMSSMFDGALGAGLFTLLAVETVFLYFLLDGQSPYLYEGGMVLITVAFVGMVMLLGTDGFALADVLEAAPLRWIGKKSYGIYLWQYPVIYLFHVRGWDALQLYGLLELAIIVVLAIWSGAAADCITRLRLPVKGRFAMPRAATFLAASLCALVFMGFGCQGIALSASSKAPDTALQSQLAKNAAVQQAENEKSAQEAAAREAQKAAEKAAAQQQRMAEVDLSGAACIGDSVMLGASPALRQVLPGCFIDAEVSRYVGGGLEAAKALAAQGHLGNIVVIALGTNGPIAGYERYAVQTNELLEYLGPNRHIFWVNVYCPKLTWQQVNNDCIRDMPIAHPNVTVIDWYSLVKDHPEWLTSDGIHPNDEGIKAYANLVHDTIVKTLAK
ncbi:MAG: acyltransferase family protein [Selenomonas sp.]